MLDMRGRRRRQDVWAGLVFAAIGAGGLVFGRAYSAGTAFHMGPGYVPRVVSVLLVLTGVATAIVGLAAGRDRIGATRLRPLVVVLLAMAAFALAIEHAGLAIAVVITTLVAGFAEPAARLRELAALAVALAVTTVVLFVYALGLPIAVLPR